MHEKRTLTLVLNDMPFKTTLRDLFDAFEKHGQLAGLKITPRIREEKQLYVGFVTFENSDDGRKVMADMNNVVSIHGSEVSISFATRSLKKKKPDAFTRAGFHRTKVHVSGIPPSYTEEELSELLGKCKLYLPKDGKGYCFADYGSEKEKNEVINKLDGKVVDEKYELKFAPAFIGGKRDEKREFTKDFKKRGDRKKESTMEE